MPRWAKAVANTRPMVGLQWPWWSDLAPLQLSSSACAGSMLLTAPSAPVKGTLVVAHSLPASTMQQCTVLSAAALPTHGVGGSPRCRRRRTTAMHSMTGTACTAHTIHTSYCFGPVGPHTITARHTRCCLQQQLLCRPGPLLPQQHHTQHSCKHCTHNAVSHRPHLPQAPSPNLHPTRHHTRHLLRLSYEPITQTRTMWVDTLGDPFIPS